MCDVGELLLQPGAILLANFERDGNVREKYNVVTDSPNIQVAEGYRDNIIGFGVDQRSLSGTHAPVAAAMGQPHRPVRTRFIALTPNFIRGIALYGKCGLFLSPVARSIRINPALDFGDSLLMVKDHLNHGQHAPNHNYGDWDEERP